MAPSDKSLRVLVVGGGPTGALCAKGLAENGFSDIILCEAYPHPSNTLRGNKAYCIVLSPRGQRALQECNINPMKIPGAVKSITLARHSTKGIRPWLHEDHPSVVVSRKSLAGYLLDQAKEGGVSVKLQYKLVDIDFENKIATFETANDDKKVEIRYDLLVGCDGSNSQVRTLLARHDATFSVRTEHDTMEYQVAILSKPFVDIAIHKEKAESLPSTTVHSWNHRASNSLCLAFPHEDGGILFTVIYPGGKLKEFKENDSYAEALELLLPDVSQEARAEIIEQLKEGEPSTGGTCVWPSSLGSSSNGIVLVGDSSSGMFPSLGQGANCALESAAVFLQTATEVSPGDAEQWSQQLAIEYNTRRFDDATAAVTLTYSGMGGSKSRHVKNASLLFILQITSFMLLHKVTCGMVPQPAMLRLMFGENESYSSLARDHLKREPQKLILVGLSMLVLIASYLYMTH